MKQKYETVFEKTLDHWQAHTLNVEPIPHTDQYRLVVRVSQRKPEDAIDNRDNGDILVSTSPEE